MNNPTAYTPLESLFLFQALLAHGVEPTAFGRISELLRNNALIKESETYDARRLSPDSLRELFLHLLRDELRSDASPAERSSDGNVSPNSKKRKVQSPPLPTLKDAQAHIEKLPLLVDRLYARYRDHVICQIREDEQRYERIQQEIQDLEKGGSDDKAVKDERKVATKNGAPVVEEPKGAKRPNGPVTTPSLPVTIAAKETIKKGPTPVPVPVPPVLPGKRDTAPPSTPYIPPPVTVQTPILPGTPIAVGQEPRPNGTTQVLQPPIGATQGAPHRVQTPIQPPHIPHIQPRQDSTAKPKGTPAPPAQPQTPGTLKWEKPYQPQAPIAAQGRQHPGTVPPGHTGPSLQQQTQPPSSWHPPPSHASNAVPHPQTPQPAHIQPYPVLAQPGSTGQLVAPMQPGSIKGRLDAPGSGVQPPPNRTPQTPIAPPARHETTQKPPGQDFPLHIARQIAAMAALKQPGASPGTVPQQGRPQGAPYPQQQLPPVGTPINRTAASQEAQRHYNSPYNHQALRPAIPEHMRQNPGLPGTPGPRGSANSSLPQTPVTATPTYIIRGSGTRWKVDPSPSTPKESVGELPSPAFEPLSPILKHTTLATPTVQPPARKKTPKPVQKIDTSAGKSNRARLPKSLQRNRSLNRARGRSPSVTSQTDELSLDHHDLESQVKEEDVTPRPHDETGDTTADESIPSRRQLITPRNVSARLKRKRQDTPVEPVPPPLPPSHVLWTRSFPKVSNSILEQISGHRDANMFANPIRDKDAPGYKGIVLQSQDIKSIRIAITQGNKAATQAAANLPGGDQTNSGTVWLPISEDLVPPRGIINSAQLERELVHMFSNAIMYNLDPDRGPGPAFTKRGSVEEGDDEPLGYEVDENGVVNNTRNMFLEVEKLLGDLRSAEKERTGPAPSTTVTRPGSVATGAGDESTTAPEDDVDELAGDGDLGSTTKRRRISTRG